MALWRVRATVVDKPGFLAVLAASLALRGVNILSVGVHITEAGAVDDFLVDAPDELSRARLLAAVERGRGRDAWAAPAHAHLLVDAPTRALDLATLVVREPDAVAEALAELLDATATWRPAPASGLADAVVDPGGAASGYGPAGTRMRVPAPAGGSWLLERPAPEFTPAEYARAQALLAVAMTARTSGQEPAPGPVTLILADGREVVLRRGGPADLEQVRQLHRRCSPTTLYRRYLTGTQGPSEATLARLLAPARGAVLVAETTTGGAGAPPGAVVAMANLVGEGVQAELALLVEDGWQRCGLGTALLRRAARLAAADGFEALAVHSHAQNVPIQRTLRRLAGARQTVTDAGVSTVTLQLSGTAAVGGATPADPPAPA